MNNYYHLSPEERATIMIERQQSQSIRAISRLLGRSASTVSRELKRHQSMGKLSYCASIAGRQYRENRKRCERALKLIPNTPLYETVEAWLVHKQWSPEQISGTLKQRYPKQKDMQVSHETIYACIYAHPKGELKKLMIQSLRRSKSKRGPRGSKDSNYNSVKMAESQLIHHRPEDINERKMAGHWEGDLIVGAKNRSCVGTLVERKTGYLILSKMKSKTAFDVRVGFEERMQHIPHFLRLSMTYDRGSEMAQHTVMSKHLKMTIYFADPHAPWQRGSNENANGLIRQYLPKGEDLSPYSQRDLDHIAWLLNSRPRKRFDFKAPEDMINLAIAENTNRVALEF